MQIWAAVFSIFVITPQGKNAERSLAVILILLLNI